MGRCDVVGMISALAVGSRSMPLLCRVGAFDAAAVITASWSRF